MQAAASFTPNAEDTADALVSITFASGAREQVEAALANPASAHSWRLLIGTPAGGSGGPLTG